MSNVGEYGAQLIRIGMTADHLIFNTELFEKCATTFVTANRAGKRIHTVPWIADGD